MRMRFIDIFPLSEEYNLLTSNDFSNVNQYSSIFASIVFSPIYRDCIDISIRSKISSYRQMCNERVYRNRCLNDLDELSFNNFIVATDELAKLIIDYLFGSEFLAEFDNS